MRKSMLASVLLAAMSGFSSSAVALPDQFAHSPRGRCKSKKPVVKRTRKISYGLTLQALFDKKNLTPARLDRHKQYLVAQQVKRDARLAAA